MQYIIFLYVDPPSYQVMDGPSMLRLPAVMLRFPLAPLLHQILKNLNIISTGVLYRIFLQKR